MSFLNALGEVDQSRFSWDQLETAHKQSKTFIPLLLTYRVEVLDGTTITGILQTISETEIKIQLDDVGILTINRGKIKKLVPLDVSQKIQKENIMLPKKLLLHRSSQLHLRYNLHKF